MGRPLEGSSISSITTFFLNNHPITPIATSVVNTLFLAIAFWGVFPSCTTAGENSLLVNSGGSPSTMWSSWVGESDSSLDLASMSIQVSKSETSNHCLRFDGTNDWLDMIDLEIQGDYTLEAWVFLVGLMNASDAIVGQVGLGQDVNCHDGYWRWYAPPGPNQFGDRVIARTQMRQNTWTHVALTRHDGSLRLLLNGVVDATGYGPESFIPKAIGRGNDGYGIYGFLEGKMDEIRIWNIYRDDEQISSNYWHPLTGPEPGLVAYWNFDEGAGQVAHDLSGNGNDAPLGTTLDVETSDPTWIQSDIPGWSEIIPTPTQTPIPPTPTLSPTVTATATPTNGVPSQPLVVVEPEIPTTLDDLYCSVTGSIDPEGGPVLFTYSWYCNGELITGVNMEPMTGPSLSHVYTTKGDTVLCVVTPFDGIQAGPQGSDSVTIINSPPTAPAIRLLPEVPTPSDGLAVWIEQQSTDADGDYIAYLFEWYDSSTGADWTLRPELSGNESPFVQGQPEISRNYTQAGDYWRVVVTPVELLGKTSGSEAQISGSDKQTTKVFGESASASILVLPDFQEDGGINSQDLVILMQVWQKRKGDLPSSLRPVFFEPRDSSDLRVGKEFLLKMAGGCWKYQE
jgi:hypothetical protein